MLDCLRDPAWQGVAGIVAIISLILFVIVERGKFFGKININKQRIIISILIVVFFISVGILTIGSFLTVDAFVSRFGQLWGGIIGSVFLTFGLLIWFAFFCILLLGKSIDNIVSFLGRLSLYILFCGILVGLMSSLTESKESTIDRIYTFGQGAFTIGSAIVFSLAQSQKTDKSIKNNSKE